MIDLSELKARVAALEYTDDLALDVALAEIDLIIYKLRTECFAVKKPLGQRLIQSAREGRAIVNNLDWGDILNGIK